MAGVIDTNLLLYAVNLDAPEHGRAVAFLQGVARSESNWYLTEGIVYEFLRVSTHPRVFARPLKAAEALSFVEAILAGARVAVLSAGPRHWPALAQLLGELRRPAGNLFFDVRTLALMREHGVRRIHTADTDFLQFPGIEVVDPLRAR
jgi:toxin-antitoxin system PIN domain toxin